MSQDRVLRVLAIDDDSVSLKILVRNLEQCGYQGRIFISSTRLVEVEVEVEEGLLILR